MKPAFKPRNRPKRTMTYCDEHYAVKDEDGKCPRCKNVEAVYEKFCRKCLHVHTNTKQCEAWKAKC